MRKLLAALAVVVLCAPIAARADDPDLDLRDLFRKLPANSPLGKVLTKALAEQLVKGHPFDVRLDPNMTAGSFLDMLDRRQTKGVDESIDRPDKAAVAYVAAPGVTIPKSYNFFTKKKTKRCLFDGPMSQFEGTCWAHAAAVAVSTAVCKAESDAGTLITRLDGWVSPQQLVTCMDKDRKSAAFNDGYTGALYGRGYRSVEAINRFVTARSPFVTLDCAPVKACSFGDWKKKPEEENKVTCVAPDAKFPACITGDRPICATTHGALPKRIQVAGAQRLYVDADPKKAAQTMQTAILEHGPIIVSIDVFDDFSLYAGGIYRHKRPKGGWERGHAVIVYGWGEEKGKPYWLMMNSWGKDDGVQVDGEKLPVAKRSGWDQFTDDLGFTDPPPPNTTLGGFYKIARGENMIGIEEAPAYVKVDAIVESRDLALTLARPSAPAILSTWSQSDEVLLAKLAGDAYLELDIYLPANALKGPPALASKREVDSVFLRFYAQTCRQGDEVGAPGGFEVLALKGTEWKVVGKQACAAAADTQPEIEVTKVVNAVLAEAKPPTAKPCKPVQCIRAPCPKSTCGDVPPNKVMLGEIPPPKLTLRIRAAAGATGEVRLSKATRSEPYEGMTPPPPQKSQNPDEDYIAPPAYLWPPAFVATAVKTEKGAENVSPKMFPRLRFELRAPVASAANDD